MLSQLWPLILASVGMLAAGGGAAWAYRLAWVRSFLARAEQEAHSVVLEVEQTYVDRILAARALDSPGGAELTEDEQAIALQLAVKRLAEMLGLTALERALRVLGLPRTPEFVTRWLTTRVEAHVKRLSLEQGGKT